MSNLNEQQFYQRPLPGMEHIGANPKLPVGQIFKHPEIDRYPGEYNWVNLRTSHTRRVRTAALRPTQPYVEEGYLYNESRTEGNPGALQDGKGRYRLVDGHHRVARALLNGEQHIDVQVFGPGRR